MKFDLNLIFHLHGQMKIEFARHFLYTVNTMFNPLKTKSRLLYLKSQFVPRSKHFSSRL